MTGSDEQIKRIQEKLQKLIRQHSVLQKENARLVHELDQSKEQSVSYQKNVDVLKEQVNVLRLNAGDMSEGDKKEFEKKINGYLKEIDRCIALLGE
jgi:hypothetical protein